MKNLNDWKISEYLRLMRLLSLVGTATETEDISIWKLNSLGVFSIKPHHLHLVRGEGARLAFLACEVVRERIVTLDKLIRREKILANGCYLCTREAKSCVLLVQEKGKVMVLHTFLVLSCVRLWLLACGILGLSLMITRSVREELCAWKCI